MSVLSQLERWISKRTVHMTLIDPDKAPRPIARQLAAMAGRTGSDAIMVGGSTGLDRESLDDCVLGIREAFEGPIILFPPAASALSPHADALYFMSLLNSRDPRFIVGEQTRGAPVVKRMGLEPIPLGYIIVEPGMAAGKVGQADPVARDDVERAAAISLCAQYLGMRMVYLEAGSGSPVHVPPEMVRAVRREVDIIVIVGGGIRDAVAARELVAAGADIIVTGTLVEGDGDPEAALRGIIAAMREGWEARR
ncbi:MAG: geranylgeranylglyceryl/heptaprenylglyceryl phosphate synthase [Thermoplasmata archaeon]|nr:geranylgeranylglyceryl/heptaprenylglyceryl phosphate synthase [Thermoplasmata archaeon]